MTLLERLSVASHEMTLAERFFASVQVALMGIGIVFAALFMLFLIIKVLEKGVAQSDVGAKKKKDQEVASVPAQATADTKEEAAPEEDAAQDTQEQEQLVAVITAAVAASLHTSTHNIVVRNIVRTNDTAPAWNRLGRIQQINRQLH
ncbi:MAG: sodium pump decarboxylase subunit gamma [Tindallia sp. MSAO_Bac2]|nr:MAG: sodium pump decarboxylase subunit gamma [Tindallia sp. MSAO_Bac2]